MFERTAAHHQVRKMEKYLGEQYYREMHQGSIARKDTISRTSQTFGNLPVVLDICFFALRAPFRGCDEVVAEMLTRAGISSEVVLERAREVN